MADSWVTDGHKWLQVPYDSGFAIVRDREAHQRAMTQWSSYLPTINATDRVPVGLRAGAIAPRPRHPGLGHAEDPRPPGVADLVERHCALTRRMADRLSAEPGINLRNEVTINQLIVDFGAGDAFGAQGADRGGDRGRTAGGVCFAGGAAWRGDWVMRISVTSGSTTEADIDLSADAIIGAWRAVRG